MKHKFFWVLALITIISNADLGAIVDSIRSRYAITDARNPDCICHRFQNKAEKEYIKVLGKNTIKEIGSSANVKIQKENPFLSITAKHRCIFHRLNRSGPKKKTKKIKTKRLVGMRFKRKDISSCFTNF